MDTNPDNWKTFYNNHPDAHLLQSPSWALLKSSFGWYAKTLVTGDIGSQILFRKLPLGLSIAYVPKGPVGDFSALPEHIQQLDKLCKENGAIFLKLEPDIFEEDPNSEALSSMLIKYGNPAKNIQPRRTVIVPLVDTPDNWLAEMKQKTRYNIRLAMKKDIVITQSTDLQVFQQLMETTGARNEFGVHSYSYYQQAFSEFYPDAVRIFLASYLDEPLAAIMVYFRGKLASYFYGASSNKERNRMPTYLLQFEAMKWAAQKGCTEYDLWGIPDETEEILEEKFKERSDGLWGVYRFKRGFGGQVKRTISSVDRVYKPFLYQLYLKRSGSQNDSH